VTSSRPALGRSLSAPPAGRQAQPGGAALGPRRIAGLVGIRQRTPYLIGRDEPLHALLDALDRRDGRSGSLVLVSGEAGIGKTRLLDEFAARADTAQMARGGCVEGVAYAPWTDALWWLLDSPGLVDRDELAEGVRLQLARLLPQLGVAPVDDDEGGQHVLFEAVVGLLAHAGGRTKLVVVVDDLHWIDPASRELLRYVAANLRRVPMLLVAAYRPEDSLSQRELIAQLGRLGQLRIALEPLSDDATTELAGLLMDDDDGAAVEPIVRNSDGNPLFVEELVAARNEAHIPPTLRDLMSVRFNSLDDDARHLVRTAALIGVRAPRAWLTAATKLDDERARAAARRAVDAGVLLPDPDGRGYTFRHALLREAVLADIVPDERVAFHRAIAEALTDHPERAVGVEYTAELARHWDAAEDAAPALRAQVAAAQRAEARYAFDAAYEAYERALFWWDAVEDAASVAGIDHAALVLETADAAGYSGRIERAADLGRAALEEACAVNPDRGVEAAGRVYPLMWTADRGPELYDFATRVLLPVIDSVDPIPRARFLVSTVEHLLTHGTPEERRDPAARMLEAVRDIDAPAIQARAHAVMAYCYELTGEFDRVDLEYEAAGTIARDGQAHSMHAYVLYNRAAAYSSIPDLAACIQCLDEVDELVETYGLRRYLLPARCLRALASALRGDLAGATTAIASVEDLAVEGFDAWFRSSTRCLISLFAGDYDQALTELDADTVGAPAPKDFEHVIELSMLRAEALIWKGELEQARKAVDEGEDAVEQYRETYWQGRLAVTGTRIEADAAVAASSERRLDLVEHAQKRAETILAAWNAAVGQLQHVHPLVEAYSRALAAEIARLHDDDAEAKARAAAESFENISMPYYATYFRWREAGAALAHSDRPHLTTEFLKKVRATALAHGFTGLADAITNLARAHQLRLGPGRTTIDGDVPLSARELEVLRLMADGRTNPEIAEALFITRRTAAAHVSGILRKFNATTRVEAVVEAQRRGVV
jgi:DNA-binding CsgD family transcriptional regulator